MNILIFLGVILVIVLAHELGHFLTAKKFGVRVDEFGFGFPPKLFGKKFGETLYSFNLFPIGGFVKIFGETLDEESMSGPDSKRSFIHKPKWAQAIILVSGIVFNLLLAWMLIIFVTTIGAPYSQLGEIPKGSVVLEEPQTTIIYVEPNFPANKAGLLAGDKIIALQVGDDKIADNLTVEQVQQFIQKNSAEEILLTYNRNADITNTVKVTPITMTDFDHPALGIMMDEIGIIKLPFHRAILEGTKTTILFIKEITIGLIGFFQSIIIGQADFGAVAGPIGIAGIVGDAATVGVASLMILVAAISINLALINLLPFPALDGGRLLFVLIEAIIKKPIKPQIANAVNFAGFAFLLLLMIVITYKDIAKLF
ncbi:MAG: site-2 protease family protein [Patescibacteria group bacterium]